MIKIVEQTLGIKSRQRIEVVQKMIQKAWNPNAKVSSSFSVKQTVIPSTHITTTLYTQIPIYLLAILMIKIHNYSPVPDH